MIGIPINIDRRSPLLKPHHRIKKTPTAGGVGPCLQTRNLQTKIVQQLQRSRGNAIHGHLGQRVQIIFLRLPRRGDFPTQPSWFSLAPPKRTGRCPRVSGRHRCMHTLAPGATVVFHRRSRIRTSSHIRTICVSGHATLRCIPCERTSFRPF